jgi:hypothetical protein
VLFLIFEERLARDASLALPQESVLVADFADVEFASAPLAFRRDAIWLARRVEKMLFHAGAYYVHVLPFRSPLREAGDRKWHLATT